MKKDNRLKIIFAILLFFMTILSFLIYSKANSHRITEENASYAFDSAQKAVENFEKNLNSDVSAIKNYAYFIGNNMQSDEIPFAQIKQIENNSTFDEIRFTSADGVNYASDGASNNAADREYYIEGMKGNSGLSIIYSSRINGKTMIDVYAPVINDGKIIGVLRGVYNAEDYLQEMLDSTYFGEKADTYICDKQGIIIAKNSIDNNISVSANIVSEFKRELIISKDIENSFRDYLNNDKAGIVSIVNNDLYDKVCVVHCNFFPITLVQTFPTQVSRDMIYRANINALLLVAVLMLLVFIYDLYLIISAAIVQNKLEKNSQDNKYIAEGVNSLIDEFVLIDFQTQTYRFINDTKPYDASIPVEGPYALLKNVIQSMITDEEENMKISEMLDLSNISEQLVISDSDSVEFTFMFIYGGRRSWSNMEIICLSKDGGVPVKALMTRQDITSIKEEDNRIKQELKTAIDKAQKANEVKSNFLSGMSHEIRTPINAILGMTTMILRESDLNKIYEYASDIETSGRTLLSLINNILDFSKIRNDRLELIEGEYNILEIVEDCRNLIQGKIKEKQLDFYTEIDSQIASLLYGDEVRIRQIIMNLLTNAVKYTMSGHICLRIEVEQRYKDAEGNEYSNLRIDVRDTGIGIRKKDQISLFTAFRSLNDNTDRFTEGIGIGLSITQHLVQMMNGTISVESEYGMGSCFSVVLPQKISDAHPIGEHTFNITSAINVNTVRKSAFTAEAARVLVVDDTVMNLKIIQLFLKDTKIQLDLVKSGEIALAAMRKQKYDAVLLDHIMPDLDGIETYKLLKEDYNSLNQNTPVAIVTANAIVGARDYYINEGFFDYLAKPIDEERLYTMLIRMLPEEKITLL